MTVDLAAGRLRLFGGCAMTLSLSWVCTTPLNDLWQFTGSTWEPVAAAPAPGARWQAALVSDEARGRLVLAGGSGPFQNPTDLWELSGTTWADAGVNVGITTQVPSLYDRALGDTVLGSATWDGALHVAPEVLPVGPGTFDEARARGVAVETGGLRVWERALPSDRGPAHVAAFHCAELAEPTATITAVTPTFVTGADTATGPGARLQRFTGVVWATLASHSAPAAAPAALSATVTDPATLAALCVNGEMTFEASSAGGSDYAPSGGRLVGRRARLATDSVELTVRSRLP